MVAGSLALDAVEAFRSSVTGSISAMGSVPTPQLDASDVAATTNLVNVRPASGNIRADAAEAGSQSASGTGAGSGAPSRGSRFSGSRLASTGHRPGASRHSVAPLPPVPPPPNRSKAGSKTSSQAPKGEDNVVFGVQQPVERQRARLRRKALAADPVVSRTAC